MADAFHVAAMRPPVDPRPMSRAHQLPPPPPAALLEKLHEPLLALHAALETDALWKAVQAVLRAAAPSHRVTLFLGHLGMGEARVVLTDPPIERPAEWYAERGKANPFTPFIERNRGRKAYRFEEVLPSRAEWLRSDFYRRFAKAEGWDKGYSMLYWAQREVTAMFSLYRAPREPDFSADDEAVLHWLHPYIGTAITRVQRLHTERLARRSLEEFNKHLPVGLVLVSWDLKAEFANHEGQRQCLLWNHGPSGARSLNPRDAFVVPPPVLETCAALKAAVLARNPKTLTLLPGDVAAVSHRAQPELRAQVSLHNNPASALARPRFLVVLDTRPGSTSGGATGESALGGSTPAAAGPSGGDRFAVLRELTPREREIALLVCEGFSNAEIARRLSKSVLTIKTQLNSVFRKLGVTSRTRLMALLR
jgi:DNA-binding CsgD family transcriptional regulator